MYSVRGAFKGGQGGAFARRAPAPTRNFFLQSYYEMKGCTTHTCTLNIFCEDFCSRCSILFLADSLKAP